MNKFISFVVVLSVLITGCSSQNNKANSEFIWTTEQINAIFKDSCINSDNWKNKNPDEVMVEDRSLSVTKFIDTGDLTSIPTALVIGFCPIGEGSGWGNELFFVGHNTELENPNYIISEIIDEIEGLTIDSEDIKVEENGVNVKLNGYSSENEPKCCRDVTDEVLIKFEKDSPILEFRTVNSYQAKEMNKIATLKDERVIIPSDGKITLLAEQSFRKYINRANTPLELIKFKEQIIEFAKENSEKIYIENGIEIKQLGYDEKSLDDFAYKTLFSWEELKEERYNYALKLFGDAFNKVVDSNDAVERDTLAEVLK